IGRTAGWGKGVISGGGRLFKKKKKTNPRIADTNNRRIESISRYSHVTRSMTCYFADDVLSMSKYDVIFFIIFFFFSSRRRHTRFKCDWSSDVCSSDLAFLNNGGSFGKELVFSG